MFGAMGAFAEHAVTGAVLQGIGHFIHRLMVVQHFLEPVPDACDGEDAQETQEFVEQGLAEDVRTCSEEGGFFEVLQHDQGVHQGVAVVGSQDDGPIRGKVLLPVG